VGSGPKVDQSHFAAGERKISAVLAHSRAGDERGGALEPWWQRKRDLDDPEAAR